MSGDFDMNFMNKFRELCRTIEKIEKSVNPKDHLAYEPEEKPFKCNCDVGLKGYTISEDWRLCPIHKNCFTISKPEEKPKEKCWCEYEEKQTNAYCHSGSIIRPINFCPECGKPLK